MLLKCDRCNNLITDDLASVGDPCTKERCYGSFVFYANTLVIPSKKIMLKCNTCGNVYAASPKRAIFDKCGVAKCEGRLERFFG
ncbi:MAG: hypothetical protein ABIJ45_08510 [Candidatus Zixiibacteriota bacterium]